MKAALLVLVPALVATAGCAQHPSGSHPPGIAAPPRTLVLVNIENGQQTVYPDPAPIVGATNGVIKWELILDPADYVFPNDGIAFSSTLPPGKSLPAGCTALGNPADRFNLPSCKPSRDGTEFQCTVIGNPHLPLNLCYHYVVKLVRVGGSGPAQIVIDPWAKPK